MKVVVVEDSRLAREGLIRMLAAHPEITVVGDAAHPKVARELIKETRPELLFLDIHMPGESGFELLESLDYTPKVIFTTAYSDYAIQSFDHNTVDYLLKPISKERLAVSIQKLMLNKSDDETASDSSVDVSESCEGEETPLLLDSRIFVKDGDHCHLIEVGSITTIESCRNYAHISYSGGKVFIKKSLNLIEKRLPENNFLRVSRQFIVNLQRISSVEESVGEGYELGMQDGNTLSISRRGAARLKAMLSL